MGKPRPVEGRENVLIYQRLVSEGCESRANGGDHAALPPQRKNESKESPSNVKDQ